MNDSAANEWLDIVDKHDHVVGRDTRARVHELGHLHRSAHIVLFNSRGQVFVQLRSMNKDSGAGLWDTSAAGHVDSGESYVDCAVRELHEELGVEINVSELKVIGTIEPQARNGMEFTRVFTVSCDQALTLQAEEVDDGRWLFPADLTVWMSAEQARFTDVFKLIWSMVSDEQGRNPS